MYKFYANSENSDKSCKNHKKVLVFPVFCLKVQILHGFSKKLRRRASSRPQLLEALVEVRKEEEKNFSLLKHKPKVVVDAILCMILITLLSIYQYTLFFQHNLP